MSDIRKLKVYYQSAGDSSVPTILLKGKWLEKYGFTTGDIYCRGMRKREIDHRAESS